MLQRFTNTKRILIIMIPNPVVLIPLLKCYLEVAFQWILGSVLFSKLDITNFGYFCNSKVKSMSDSPSKKVLISCFPALLSQNLNTFHDDGGDDHGGDFDSGSN